MIKININININKVNNQSNQINTNKSNNLYEYNIM